MNSTKNISGIDIDGSGVSALDGLRAREESYNPTTIFESECVGIGSSFFMGYDGPLEVYHVYFFHQTRLKWGFTRSLAQAVKAAMNHALELKDYATVIRLQSLIREKDKGT